MHNVTIIAKGNGIDELGSNLYEAVCVSLYFNALEKGMNSCIATPIMSKIVE